MKEIGFWSTAWLFTFSLLALLFAIGSSAHSQEAPPGPPCMPAKDLLAAIQKGYGETVTAAGVVGNDFIEVLTNKLTGTFTILIRKSDGNACIIVGGKGFALADPAKMKGSGL